MRASRRPEERASTIGEPRDVSWAEPADHGWDDDDAEKEIRGGDDPREEELREGDADRHVESTRCEVERELAPAYGEALAEIGRRSVLPHAREYDAFAEPATVACAAPKRYNGAPVNSEGSREIWPGAKHR
jgi:hypothetical protein